MQKRGTEKRIRLALLTLLSFKNHFLGNLYVPMSSVKFILGPWLSYSMVSISLPFVHGNHQENFNKKGGILVPMTKISPLLFFSHFQYL